MINSIIFTLMRNCASLQFLIKSISRMEFALRKTLIGEGTSPWSSGSTVSILYRQTVLSWALILTVSLMMQRVERQRRKKEREKYSEITNANKGREENDKFKEMKKVTSKVILKSAILKIMIAMEKQKNKRKEKINY